MSTQTGQPGTGWKVTDQQPLDKVGAGNRVESGVEVHFQTQYGATGSVWLRRLDYTPENARTAIAELAATMDDVHTLEG